MPSQIPSPPAYHDLPNRTSTDSFVSVSDWEEEAGLVLPSNRPWQPFWRTLTRYTRYTTNSPRRRRRFSSPRWSALRQLLRLALICLTTVIIITAIFFPSYTHLPPHYQTLAHLATHSAQPGRANPRQERVFIAAILYDPAGTLARGRWGEALLQLIDLLGPDHVYLSIYESSSGSTGAAALDTLAQRLPCNHTLRADPPPDLTTFPTIPIPGGGQRIKRTTYLSELRNRALAPLDTPDAPPYDRIFYLNDVIFSPHEAIHLLFSTHTDPTGLARYRAACAVDFINPFKFYDTYATRDLQGYGIGLQFYPWFTTAGDGVSRQDVVAQTDAVRVRSCWGGMVAFNASFFQRADNPVRFRADGDLFFDGSECCIVHADLVDSAVGLDGAPEGDGVGVYMNPYVRTAYTERTFRWLGVTRRVERLYALLHGGLSWLAGLPRFNPRRTQVKGDRVRETLWVADAHHPNGGQWQEVERLADNDGFCADGFGERRGMQVIREKRGPGEEGWEEIPVPVA
ncbi:glycosyltransferase family 69 protein [Aspergillus saccharolyticus JOP 1030-1]|uniref:Glycosyltransferase family 69 protein n=1 Tax=Aspergillus saccharolyticus JOP 1030-1 TaxID=1450539 RepID=A0A318Z934_9EURO|nr:hypothetical protein BP01DRAFT_359130 [Aspergillus saccharolyticus JOP 1030-1]PYH42907.1 hypothetical protein BP01DRAFT_359130 [Aspergillus saccharolyticus JOP 1030-1]